MHSLICVREQVKFNGLFGFVEMMRLSTKKKIILLFACYFQGNLLDSFLEHPAKGEQQITFEVGLSHIGD
jgi:hypothetical protein